MAGWIPAQHVVDYEAPAGTEQLVKCTGGSPDVVTLTTISDTDLTGQVVLKLPRHPTMPMATDSGESNFGGS